MSGRKADDGTMGPMPSILTSIVSIHSNEGRKGLGNYHRNDSSQTPDVWLPLMGSVRVKWLVLHSTRHFTRVIRRVCRFRGIHPLKGLHPRGLQIFYNFIASLSFWTEKISVVWTNLSGRKEQVGKNYLTLLILLGLQNFRKHRRVGWKVFPPSK